MRAVVGALLGLAFVLAVVAVVLGAALLKAKGRTRLPFWSRHSYELLASRAWHEPKTRALVDAVLRGPRQGLALLDAGAWVGDLCVSAAEAFPGSAVVAVEPAPGLARFVRELARRNGLTNLAVHQAALSDIEGVAVRGSKSGAPDSSWTPTDGLGEAGSGEAETVTLDGLRQRGELPKLGLLHLDVEGAELAAFRGGLGCVRSDRPFVVVETLRDRSAVDQIGAELKALGYASGADVDEVCVFADFGDKHGCRNVVFAPNEDAAALQELAHLFA